MSIYFFQPVPKYTIWGGKACNRYFHFTEIFHDGVGQALAFSAQKENETVCLSGEYRGMSLRQIWCEYPSLFGRVQGEFPLIISLVAPEDNLSIQVHPDADHAAKHGYSMGKNEAWYFIRCTDRSSIAYGHSARDALELRSQIAADQWDSIPTYLPVKAKDFVYIPAGRMHALCKNTVVYEIQQATDVTYRFYDYGRKDSSGAERQLNLEEAIDTLQFGAGAESNPVSPVVSETDNLTETTLIRNSSFTVTRLEISGKTTYQTAPYRVATVVEGEGTADGQAVVTGRSFLIPVNTKVSFAGAMTVMMATREEV